MFSDVFVWVCIDQTPSHTPKLWRSGSFDRPGYLFGHYGTVHVLKFEWWHLVLDDWKRPKDGKKISFSLKLTESTWEWMGGIGSFPFGMAYFQVAMFVIGSVNKSEMPSYFREIHQVLKHLQWIFCALHLETSPA